MKYGRSTDAYQLTFLISIQISFLNTVVVYNLYIKIVNVLF